MPDVPVGCVWPNEPSDPKRKICGAIDSDFLTEGEDRAGLPIVVFFHAEKFSREMFRVG